MTRGSPGRFLILGKHLQHHDPRPPIVVGPRAKHAAGCLVVQCPIDILLCLRLQPRIAQQIRKRRQAIQEIRSAFPGLAGTSQPSAVRAHIRPGLIQMTAETVCLNLQLRPQPPGRPDRTQRQQIERVLRKWRAILHRCRPARTPSRQARWKGTRQTSKSKLLEEEAPAGTILYSGGHEYCSLLETNR